MWDFFETVRHRHSVRRYRSDAPVEQAQLRAILEMACAAPSAGDLQSYRIIVVTDRERREGLSRAAGGQGFIAEAPACLVFCADPARSAITYGERGRDLYALQDATIAAAYSQLAIVASGMASGWVGAFDEGQVSSVLGLESGLVPIAIIPFGYPAELPEATPRRHLDEVVEYR